MAELCEAQISFAFLNLDLSQLNVIVSAAGQSRSMCDSSYRWKQERWNVYCTEVTFTGSAPRRMSSRHLGCIVGTVLRRSHFADLLKYAAEICWIGITTAGRDLL